jgi:HSP20 family protein
MTLTTHPYSNIDNILDTFFGPTISKTSFRFAENNGFPKLNIYSKKDGNTTSIVVEAAIAGYNVEEIEVKIDKNILSFSHSKVEDGWNDDVEKTFLNEIKQSSFTRKVLLPDTLNFDSAAVSFKNGILRVTIQEDEKSAPKILRVKDTTLIA